MKVGDKIMVIATVVELREEGPFPIELDVHGNHVVLSSCEAKYYRDKERGEEK